MSTVQLQVVSTKQTLTPQVYRVLEPLGPYIVGTWEVRETCSPYGHMVRASGLGVRALVFEGVLGAKGTVAVVGKGNMLLHRASARCQVGAPTEGLGFRGLGFRVVYQCD